MTITKEIAEFAKTLAGDLTVADVCLGVGYSCVKLSDRTAGLAYTFREELGESCGVIGNAGMLIGMRASDMMDWADSPSLAQASLGIAAVNAVLGERFYSSENIASAVECKNDDVVGMIGYFCPLVGKFAGAEKLYIYDKSMVPGPAGNNTVVMPEESKSVFLPKCNKIVLTGTSFINKTADGILELCKNAEEIIIVGASTPMCPEVLKKYGVTLLAGTRVLDPDMTMRITSQGGGGMAFSGVSLKLLERI